MRFRDGLDRFFLRNSIPFLRANRTLPKESFADVRKRLVHPLSPIPGMVRFCSFGNLEIFLMCSIKTYTRRLKQTSSTVLNDFWAIDHSDPDSRSWMLSRLFDRPVSRFHCPHNVTRFPATLPSPCRLKEARDFSDRWSPAVNLGALGILKFLLCLLGLVMIVSAFPKFVSMGFSKFEDIQSKIIPPNLVLAGLGSSHMCLGFYLALVYFSRLMGLRKAKKLRPIVLLCILPRWPFFLL